LLYQGEKTELCFPSESLVKSKTTAGNLYQRIFKTITSISNCYPFEMDNFSVVLQCHGALFGAVQQRYKF